MPLLTNIVEATEVYVATFAAPVHDKSTAPPPVGDGGSRKAGSGKAVARMSADPNTRTKPIPGFSLDLSDDDLNEARELGFGEGGVRSAIHAAFTGDLGGGYHSTVIGYDHQIPSPANGLKHPMIKVKGKILNADGQAVGGFERTIVRDDRTLFVQHDLLYINPKQQNQGLADRFNSRAIAQYQQMGVDRIVLDAALTRGGFAWARQGFRISDGGNQFERHNMIVKLASGHRETEGGGHEYALTHPSKEDREELKALVAASQAGQDIQPIDIASIGETRAKNREWYGKTLLMGASWPGVFLFDRKHPVTAAAVQLEYADRRPAWRL
mgnify:CR=1 FL=1